MKKDIIEFNRMKKTGEKLACITAYDYSTARLAEESGIDIIIVGDSFGMTLYGYENTIPVTMDECINHCKAVRRGAPNTFVIGDMPFMSYQSSLSEAIKNSGRFLKEAQMDAIKLEGGHRVEDKIKGIVDAGILVMGHIGLTAQSIGQLGGAKAQGRTAESAEKIIKDAICIEKAGAFAILLEAVPSMLGAAIREIIKIPVYSIGAGKLTDGQLLIYGDMLGYFDTFMNKFAKKYLNLSILIKEAIQYYINDVRNKEFPGNEHSDDMFPEEIGKFQEIITKYKKYQ